MVNLTLELAVSRVYPYYHDTPSAKQTKPNPNAPAKGYTNSTTPSQFLGPRSRYEPNAISYPRRTSVVAPSQPRLPPVLIMKEQVGSR